MIPRRLVVTFDARDPARLAAFWAGVLGRRVVEDGGGALLPGEAGQLGLRFVAGAGEKGGPNHLHLHLTSTSVVDQQHHGRDGPGARRPTPRRRSASRRGARRPCRP